MTQFASLQTLNENVPPTFTLPAFAIVKPTGSEPFFSSNFPSSRLTSALVKDRPSGAGSAPLNLIGYLSLTWNSPFDRRAISTLHSLPTAHAPPDFISTVYWSLSYFA